MNSILNSDLEAIANSNIPFERLRNAVILITGATGLMLLSDVERE